MFNKNLKKLFFVGLLILVSGATAFAQTSAEETSTVGTIESIDPETKIIKVKSNGDLVTAFKWAGKATAHGIKEGAIWTANASHIGATVAVRSVKIAGVDTVKGIEWFGQGTAKVVEGTVRYIGKTGKKVGITIADGAEEVYQVSEHAVVKTAKATYHGAKFVAQETAKGTKATIHFFERDGKKVAHFIAHM